jgi:hypothetical protein
MLGHGLITLPHGGLDDCLVDRMIHGHTGLVIREQLLECVRADPLRKRIRIGLWDKEVHVKSRLFIHLRHSIFLHMRHLSIP